MKKIILFSVLFISTLFARAQGTSYVAPDTVYIDFITADAGTPRVRVNLITAANPTTTARGIYMRLEIDGIIYVNCSTGSALWSVGDGGIAAMCQCILGGITLGNHSYCIVMCDIYGVEHARSKPFYKDTPAGNYTCSASTPVPAPVNKKKGK